MIKGNGVNLRHIESSELDDVLRLMNDVELKGDFARTLMRSPIKLKREFELNGLSSESNETLVIVNQSNQIVGTIVHFLTVPYSSARELGFSIFDTNNQGKGVATEAVKLLTKYLFQSQPINRIQICMPVIHEACEKIAINSGFIKEGIIRESIFVKGKYLDTCMYSMLRSDFENNT
ncbi:GNAT family N-acetyltransferase [Photobacterium lipolyticum]|uniref:GNAT family N-acetyltransferase n=1 Tax=Photobacterium lipolyticum TaxID=266810 RepID=UPI0014726FB8|nr:GNAT family protein [Photobacterium lipolyticum]